MDESTASHHLAFAAITAAVLLIIYIAINTPSASTSNTGDAEPGPIITMIDRAHNGDSDPVIGPRTVSSPQVPAQVNATKQPEESKDPGSASPAAADNSTSDHVNKGRIEHLNQGETIDGYLQKQPWIKTRVRKGDTLSQLFSRYGIASGEAYAIAELDQAKSLLKIKPGEILRLKIGEDGKLGLLEYRISPFESLMVKAENGVYSTDLMTREPEIRINNARAIIYSSLLAAAGEAGVSINTIYNFIAMFGWKTDFSTDLRVGDQFSLIYEELYLDGEKVSDGEIIAAELIVSNKSYRAVRHVDEDGFTDYFAPNGDGIKGTFLRSPLKFGHITSAFSNSRLHPIKKIWRAHKGVDYGAPRGTPVMATGDGVIKLARREGDYGKTVIVRHGGKYETLYAHLRGYAGGIEPGARVKQGDVIGYVGSTGLSTGPHLHYEFRVHGVHQNPVTVEFPKSSPIAEKYLSQFEKIAAVWARELDHLNRIPLAQNENNF